MHFPLEFIQRVASIFISVSNFGSENMVLVLVLLLG